MLYPPMLSNEYFDGGNARYNAKMKTIVLKYALYNALSDGYPIHQ